MGMSDFYGDGDEAESIATIHRAIKPSTRPRRQEGSSSTCSALSKPEPLAEAA
jgi:hypothetical protein